MDAEYKINRCNGCDRPMPGNREDYCDPCWYHDECDVDIQLEADEDGSYLTAYCRDHKEWLDPEVAEELRQAMA